MTSCARGTLLGFALMLCAMAPTPVFSAPAVSTSSDVATTPSAVSPRKAGEKAPDATVQTATGESLQLADLYSSAPTVLIFYRGGWCPYCNTQLGKIATIEKDLVAAGFQVVALSSDAPQFLDATAAKAHAQYTLLSDSDANASRAFGLAFRVDDATVEKYKNYKIDLAKSAGGKDHHILPVPAVYIIDKAGTIRYAYSNPDYKVRADETAILQAAKKIGK